MTMSGGVAFHANFEAWGTNSVATSVGNNNIN